MHIVEKHFWILEQAGLKLCSTKPGDLRLVIADDLRAWARQEVAELRPGRIVYVHPAAHWPMKCWDNESMARVIDWIQSQPQLRVIVNTGPLERDRARTRDVIALCRTKPRHYDGTLSLAQSAALIAETDGFFGVDTAPMHIAAACGVPIVALFGPTGVTGWRPWSARARVLSHPCHCNKTARQTCPEDRTRACMAAITFDEARAALEEILGLPQLASVAVS
jgi:heptosyltransferase-3